MIKVVIIDDEQSEIFALQQKLQLHCNDIEIVATCRNVSEAVRAIHKFSPQIVFSDIEMPELSGLQLLDFFEADELNFELIFVTSYSEYAVRAFQLSAIDYLLKPVDEKLLIAAIDKVRKKQNIMQRERNVILKENLEKKPIEKIALSMASGVNFLSITDIIFLKADNVYTEVIVNNTPKIVVSKPLKDFEKLLPKSTFFRCHRSYIVNLNFVKEYIAAEGGDLLLSNGSILPVARDRKSEFYERWKDMKL